MCQWVANKHSDNDSSALRLPHVCSVLLRKPDQKEEYTSLCSHYTKWHIAFLLITARMASRMFYI